ncbi:MAG: hypothetical protein RLY78_2506 [Pseudomonadota bacterium]|jgi:rubredoxin|uniref:Uncharacterized protein n=1 Tax=Pseudaquabacterium rugosum TaxID=2984194 RepID=A0ABU9BCC5_9BURK
MNTKHPPNHCRLCGATSYRAVIARDAAGALRANGQYQCSGCGLVFRDPKDWRGSACAGTGTEGAAAAAPAVASRAVAAASALLMQAPV